MTADVAAIRPPDLHVPRWAAPVDPPSCCWSWLGVGALAGGATLVSQPDGSVMKFPPSLLAGSPFTDYFVPGRSWAAFFGLGSFAVAVLGLKGWRVAPFLAFAIGCGQMIWIVVELAIIKELSFLHPVMFGVGLGIAVASVHWGWPTFQVARSEPLSDATPSAYGPAASRIAGRLASRARVPGRCPVQIPWLRRAAVPPRWREARSV